ncbi:MAG: polysaccharide biosynthesis tyrosine autokinase [Paludibacteraceae bacterium]|nr:polysaccharide biosynthesis tyrosine autokinase [Paludibacteraceae bacterium]
MDYYSDKNSKYYYSNETPIIENSESNFNILEWVFKFLRYWYLFVIALVIAFGLAYLKNRSWMPQYYTEAKVLIESSSADNAYGFMQGFGAGMDYMNTNNQLLILGSYDLINRTVQNLSFGVDFYTRGHFRTHSLYGREPIAINLQYADAQLYGREFRFIPIDNNNFEIVFEDEFSKELFPDFKIKGQYGVPFENFLMFATIDKLYLPTENIEFLFRFRDFYSLEEEFASRLQLSYIGEMSSVISVSLTGNVVARDRDFINALCEEFLEANLEEKNEEATRTINFINEQLAYIFDSLQTSENRLRQYRRQNNMVDINAYASSVLSKLSALDAQRSELTLKEAYFDELAEYLKESVSVERLVAPSSIGVSDPVLLDLVSKFNELQQKRGDLGEKNPQYERYSKRMDEVRSTMLEVLENVRKIHRMERDAFEKEYMAVMSDLQDLPEKELMMINFERAYKINDNYYTFLLQKQSEAQIRKASNVPDNKILQKARVRHSPVNGGDKMKIYLFFVVIGLLIPAAYIILKELLNTTIRDERDVVKLTNIPVLGTIRHVDESGAKVQTVEKPKSLFTEGFRLIRSRVEFISKRKTDISVLITSAESGDGKTHFAINLSGVYSLVSDKVVLVDMDIRNPKLSQKLGYKNAKGLVHVLIGEATLDEVLIKDDKELGFHFLPAGIVPPNPAELVGSEEMMKLLEELKQRYDYRIIDTSPLGLVSDAYALTGVTDVNLLITRVFKSDKLFFKNFIEQVQQDNVNNPYIVLNDLQVSKNGKYGYGKYGYGKYGYGKYGYGNTHYYHQQSAKYYTEDK